MKLVIAEKPSVAMSLAAVLGATQKQDGYTEGGGYHKNRSGAFRCPAPSLYLRILFWRKAYER